MQTNNTTRERTADTLRHPAQEEWMAYLYGEIPRPESGRLASHLRNCAECQSKVGQWRDTMSSLSEWKLAPAQPRRLERPVLRWAAAAAVVLGLAFGVGWVGNAAAKTKDAAAVRNELRQELRGEFKT